MKDKIAIVLAVLMLAGCATQAPTLLDVQKEKPLSDATVLRYSTDLLNWWGSRSTKTQAFGTGAGLALDALTTGALATAGGASRDLVIGMAAGVNFINSLIRRIDPYTRDNAFNEGAGIVLEAQGQYMKCITTKGPATPSNELVTRCGANLLAKSNSAVKIVGSLMAGLMPQRVDIETVGSSES